MMKCIIENQIKRSILEMLKKFKIFFQNKINYHNCLCNYFMAINIILVNYYAVILNLHLCVIVSFIDLQSVIFHFYFI